MISPTEELLQAVRLAYPKQIAEELCSVQPMPNIDFIALGQHPLLESFFNRHQ